MDEQKVSQRSGQKVKVTVIKTAIEKLKSVPDKPKDELTLRESIELMRPTIKQVLDKGYSYDEVATMLKEAGIQIGGATVKQYLATKPGKAARVRGSSSAPKKDTSAKVDRKAELTEASGAAKIVEEAPKAEKKRSAKGSEAEFNSY